MKFNSFASQYDIQKLQGNVPRGQSASQWYLEWNARIGSEISKLESAGRLVGRVVEDMLTTAFGEKIQNTWHDDVRPYYKLYPCIHEALQKIPLDIDMRAASIPHDRVVAIRMPVGGEFNIGCEDASRRIGSLLVSTLHMAPGHDEPIMCITAQTAEKNTANQIDGAIVSFDLSKSGTFEDELSSATKNFADALAPIVRTALGVLLMANDPAIITADVLEKDRRKYEETGDPKYIEKAKKRGIVGWSIGEQYETCPHYRRPHFGIRHTGKGGKIPRIVPIKGAVVHSKKLTTVPTGYITPAGVEVEPT